MTEKRPEHAGRFDQITQHDGNHDVQRELQFAMGFSYPCQAIVDLIVQDCPVAGRNALGTKAAAIGSVRLAKPIVTLACKGGRLQYLARTGIGRSRIIGNEIYKKGDANLPISTSAKRTSMYISIFQCYSTVKRRPLNSVVVLVVIGDK